MALSCNGLRGTVNIKSFEDVLRPKRLMVRVLLLSTLTIMSYQPLPDGVHPREFAHARADQDRPTPGARESGIGYDGKQAEITLQDGGTR